MYAALLDCLNSTTLSAYTVSALQEELNDFSDLLAAYCSAGPGMSLRMKSTMYMNKKTENLKWYLAKAKCAAF